jgi:hypothetical protein
VSQTDKRDHLDAAGPADRLYDLLNKRDRNLLLAIRVAVPATIVSYNPATQRANVTVGFLAVEDTDLPIEIADPPIVIPNVKVRTVHTATSYDHHPIAAGDTGHLLFFDRALDEWYRKPPAAVAVDPGDARAHTLSDPVFELGLSPDSGDVTPIDPAAREIDAPSIKLGSGAVDFIALAAKVLIELQAIQTWALAHTHVYNPGPGGPVPTATALPALTAPGSVAATKARAE